LGDLKVGFGMEYMPCGSFQANAVFFAIQSRVRRQRFVARRQLERQNRL
jgi:hypothetical protein